MPGPVELVDGVVADPAVPDGDPEPPEQLAKTLAMKVVERRPRALTVSHPGHGGLVESAPVEREAFPVRLDAVAFPERAPLAGDGRPPVDHRAEHVEGKGPWVRSSDSPQGPVQPGEARNSSSARVCASLDSAPKQHRTTRRMEARASSSDDTVRTAMRAARGTGNP